MRILKPLDLVPGPVELSPAIPLDFSKVWGGIDPLSLFIDGGQQFDRFKIPEGLFLPDGVGIKYGQRTGIVHLFLKKSDIVRDGLPALAVVKAIELFETGGGDLLGAFADLDAGGKPAILFLDRDQLVYATEHRLGTAGNQVFTDAKEIDLGILKDEVTDDILIERVGSDDLAFRETGFVEHHPHLLRKISDIS